MVLVGVCVVCQVVVVMLLCDGVLSGMLNMLYLNIYDGFLLVCSYVLLCDMSCIFDVCVVWFVLYSVNVFVWLLMLILLRQCVSIVVFLIVIVVFCVMCGFIGWYVLLSSMRWL